MEKLKNIVRSRGGPGAVHHCCYASCKSNSRYNRDKLFYFIPFVKPCLPYRNGLLKETEKRHLKTCLTCRRAINWLRLCQPKFGSHLKVINRSHYICSLHFVGERGRTVEHPDPVEFVSKKKVVRPRRSLAEKYGKMMDVEGNVPVSRFAPQNIVQNEPLCHEQEMPITVQELMEVMETDRTGNSTKCIDTQTESTLSFLDASTQTEAIVEEPIKKVPRTTTKATQTVFKVFPYMRRLHGFKTQVASLKRQLSQAKLARKSMTGKIFEEEVSRNDQQCRFYTGLYFYQVLALLTFLGPAVNNLIYWNEKPSASKWKKLRKLSPRQEILIVLMRLRKGFTVQDLAYRFHLSASHISNLTITWVQFMYLEFSKLRAQMFPSRAQIFQNLPAVFKRLPNIRVLVDCTELSCESPSNFQHQGNLYSQYKARTTFKVLIGCTPNGAISFVSELYEGAISDRELFNICGIVDLLDEGDLVLADRGFTVEDLVQRKGASLNIPPFMKGRTHLTAQEEIETKKIAKERICVEHVIGRLLGCHNSVNAYGNVNVNDKTMLMLMYSVFTIVFK